MSQQVDLYTSLFVCYLLNVVVRGNKKRGREVEYAAEVGRGTGTKGRVAEVERKLEFGYGSWKWKWEVEVAGRSEKSEVKVGTRVGNRSN